MAWINPPTNFSKSMVENVDSFTKKVAGEMLQQVVMRSPVLTGQYRGNHRVGINSINPTANDDTSGALEKGIATINGSVVYGKMIYISNSLPYATKIEFGHSKQAPNGVYALSFQSVVSKYK